MSCRLNGENAQLISAYLVSQKPASLSFDVYLRQVMQSQPGCTVYCERRSLSLWFYRSNQFSHRFR